MLVWKKPQEDTFSPLSAQFGRFKRGILRVREVSTVLHWWNERISKVAGK